MKEIMITSEGNAQIKELAKLLKNARERKKTGCFVVEGMKLTREAAAYGKLQKIYISERLADQEWNGLLERDIALEFQKGYGLQIQVELVTDSVFDKVSDTVTPQGILGIVSMPSYTLEDILGRKEKIFLLLDNLRDPGNLGTILRTSEGAGMAGVILSRESVDLFNPKVVRSTMGAIFRVPFVYVDSLAETIRAMRGCGIDVYGTLMEGSRIYDQIDYKKPTGIVIGNEANGISAEVIDSLTGRIRIPMEGSLESLNAAVAAAVVMYEAARQRRGERGDA